MTLPPEPLLPPPRRPRPPPEQTCSATPTTTTGTITGQVPGALPGSGEAPQARAGRGKWPIVFRLVLLALSTAGTLAALALWFTGHGALAARLVAGMVLLIFVILIVL